MHTKGPCLCAMKIYLLLYICDTDTKKHIGFASHISISPKRVAPQCEETIGRCVLLQGQGGTEERR